MSSCLNARLSPIPAMLCGDMAIASCQPYRAQIGPAGLDEVDRVPYLVLRVGHCLDGTVCAFINRNPEWPIDAILKCTGAILVANTRASNRDLDAGRVSAPCTLSLVVRDLLLRPDPAG